MKRPPAAPAAEGEVKPERVVDDVALDYARQRLSGEAHRLRGSCGPLVTLVALTMVAWAMRQTCPEEKRKEVWAWVWGEATRRITEEPT